MKIISAEVFDPALSGDYSIAPRLEVLVEGMPESATFVETNVGMFSITHRSWLQSVFSDMHMWDDEDTRECAAIFNSAMATADREAVMAVTVGSVDNGQVSWRDYYVKITRVRRILNWIERHTGAISYQCVPDATYVAEKRIAWTLEHPERPCIRCVQEAAARAVETQVVMPGDIVKGCRLQQVHARRLVPMCGPHISEWNRDHQAKREGSTPSLRG